MVRQLPERLASSRDRGCPLPRLPRAHKDEKRSYSRGPYRSEEAISSLGAKQKLDYAAAVANGANVEPLNLARRLRALEEEVAALKTVTVPAISKVADSAHTAHLFSHQISLYESSSSNAAYLHSFHSNYSEASAE